MALILLVIALFIYFGISVRQARKNLAHTENWFKVIQLIFTVAAFGLAAYWYFVERKGRPHADVSQRAHVYQVSPGLVAVEAHTSIENLGAQVLRLRHARVALQLVAPAQDDFEALWALRGDDYWNAVKPGATLADGSPNPFFHDGELRWYPIRDYDRTIFHEIEPGETDLMVTTFLARCNAQIVRIATSLEKESALWDRLWGRTPLSWKARTFADLRPACGTGPADEGQGEREEEEDVEEAEGERG